MAKRVSIREVAKAAGVSVSTVSNVFNGKQSVNAELVVKVRAVASELGYKVNKAASLLRSGRNSVVCVLVPDLKDPYFTFIVGEIEDLAQDDGFEIIVGNSGDDVQREVGRLDALLGWQPAGVIMVPCSDVLPDRLREEDAPPCVLVDRVARLDVADSVISDNVQAGAKAAKFLVENGHRRLLVAASSCSLTTIRQRADGARDVMQRYGGSVEVVELGADLGAAKQLLSRWFDNHSLPTAILATTDTTTLAVLSCLSRRGIDMPGQVSVIGFDDYTWMAARRTGITSIKQQASSIARSAWARLKARIQGEVGEVVSVVHESDLVVRESVKNIGYAQLQGGVSMPSRVQSRARRPVDQAALRQAMRSVVKRSAGAKVGG